MPELEVLADEDLPHLARAREPAHELVGGQGGEFFGEVKNDDVVRAGFLQQPRAFVDIGQRGRRCAGRERLDRERIERGRDRSPTLLLRACGGLPHERPMTDVDAVKDADGDGERTARPAGEVHEHAHGR